MRLTIFLFALCALGQEGFNGGIVVWAGPSDHSAATHSMPFGVGTTLPATCTLGEFFYKSDDTAGQRLKECGATNNWSTFASGGGSSSVTGLYSSALNFGSIPDLGCAALTFTSTGLTTGKALALSLPDTLEAGLIGMAFASAADTTTVRLCNVSGAALDPASGAFKVRDMDTLGYLTASTTINFGSIGDGNCAASTLTLAGAVAGDNVAAGWPSGLETGLTGSMFVSAADTIAVRLCNFSGAAVDPASGTFKAAITK